MGSHLILKILTGNMGLTSPRIPKEAVICEQVRGGLVSCDYLIYEYNTSRVSIIHHM